MRRRAAAWRGEDGTLTVQAPVLVLLCMVLLCVVVAVGRFHEAAIQVTSAAAQASRAASLARSDQQAVADAESAAAVALGEAGVSCQGGPVVVVDASRLGPGGQAAATVRCEVSMADVLVAGLPGQVTVTQTALSPVETYRGEN